MRYYKFTLYLLSYLLTDGWVAWRSGSASPINDVILRRAGLVLG